MPSDTDLIDWIVRAKRGTYRGWIVATGNGITIYQATATWADLPPYCWYAEDLREALTMAMTDEEEARRIVQDENATGSHDMVSARKLVRQRRLAGAWPEGK